MVTGDGLSRAGARARVTQLFSPQHDGDAIEAALTRSPMLAAHIARCPGFRPLGCWSPFELCIRTLIGQQVTVVAARTMLKRLIARCGELTRSEEHTSELQSLMRSSYAVFCLKNKKDTRMTTSTLTT